jgi:hypothetical protein
VSGVAARARAGDPATSKLAAESLRLAGSQAFVMRLFRAVREPLADHELVDLAVSAGCRLTAQRIRTARAELAARGLVVVVAGETRPTPAGRRALVWKAAGS